MKVYKNLKPGKYCSSVCQSADKNKQLDIECANCKTPLKKHLSEVTGSKSGKCFCSKSCAVTYNNTNKTHGNRRSKLETWLETELTKLYPGIDFHFNRKDAINSELDIYLPSLRLAFELNGIFHYEPIYGDTKLNQIQNNDHRKFQACIEAGISLCIIDSSGLKYFKPSNAMKYLGIIKDIIDDKVSNC